MEGSQEEYVKRTQNDCSLSFKLSVVREIERGEVSVHKLNANYGIQGRSSVVN